MISVPSVTPQFLRVVDACTGFLSKSLHLDSCIGILNLAESHVLTTLKTHTEEYITAHFSQVAKQQDFLELPADSLETVLQRDDLEVSCEECVFQALMHWVRAAREDRRPFLARLLSHVRLPLLEPAFFVEKVESDELIRSCGEAFPLLQEVRQYHLTGTEVSGPASFWNIARVKNQAIILCSTTLTGGVRANQTPLAAHLVRGVSDHRRLHEGRAFRGHGHMPGPPQAQQAGGGPAAFHRYGVRIPKQEMGRICLRDLSE